MRKLICACCLLFGLAIISAHAQSVDIDTGIKKGADYFEQMLQNGTTIAVLNVRSDSPALSEYVMDELSSHFVNRKTFTVVDRQNLDAIQIEMNYQLSGEVSDETAQSIGKRIGAETVITGGFQSFGSEHRLDLRALSVETGVIQGVLRQDIKTDNRLSAILAGRVPPAMDSWKNNWLYLGFRAGGGFVPAFFDEDLDRSNFNVAFSVMGQITEWFGAQVELMYSYIKENDNGEFYDGNNFIGYSTGTRDLSILTVPLLARFILRPNNFSFGAIFGPYIAFPLGTMDSSGTVGGGNYKSSITLKNPGFGIMSGVNFGYHIGPGVLFLDIRGYIDINKTDFSGKGYSIVNNRRIDNTSTGDWGNGSLNFCIGYELGVLKKR